MCTAALGVAFVSCLLLATASAQQPPARGNVNGTVEQPVIDAIRECIRLERDARNLAAAASQDTQLPGDVASQVQALLEQSQACLDAAIPLAQAASTDPALQESSRPGDAAESLGKARLKDVKALGQVALGAPARKVVESIQKAIGAKRQAVRAMQGQTATAPAAEDNDPPLVDPAAPEDGHAERFNVPRGPPSGWEQVRDRGIARAGVPVHGPSRKSAKKAPADTYLALRATKGTASGGSIALLPGRELRGPFEAQMTAGAMTTSAKARDALGDAFACLELDVKGASPRAFVSLCARPVPPGRVQVFATSSDGPIGQTVELDGTDFAVLDLVYDGTTVLCRAKKRSDPNFTEIAMFTRPQSAEVWTLGIRGAELGGKAEVGVDDFAVWALDSD